MPTYDIETTFGSTPTPISVFKLILTSPKDAEALFAVLSQAQLPRTVPAEDLQNMIIHRNGRGWIPERRQERTSHTEALFISAFINDYKIQRVLVDNGAGVHIVDSDDLGTSSSDRVRRLRTSRENHQRWLRESEIIQRNHLLTIRRRTSKETHRIFHVTDIWGSFNLINGRMWIHDAQAVRYTYHRCIHLPGEGLLPLDPKLCLLKISPDMKVEDQFWPVTIGVPVSSF